MRPLTPLSPLLLGAEGRTFPPPGGAPSPSTGCCQGASPRRENLAWFGWGMAQL